MARLEEEREEINLHHRIAWRAIVSRWPKMVGCPQMACILEKIKVQPQP